MTQTKIVVTNLTLEALLAEAPNKVLAVWAKGGLLEEAGHELVVLDHGDALLLQGALPRPRQAALSCKTAQFWSKSRGGGRCRGGRGGGHRRLVAAAGVATSTTSSTTTSFNGVCGDGAVGGRRPRAVGRREEVIGRTGNDGDGRRGGKGVGGGGNWGEKVMKLN